MQVMCRQPSVRSMDCLQPVELSVGILKESNEHTWARPYFVLVPIPPPIEFGLTVACVPSPPLGGL